MKVGVFSVSLPEYDIKEAVEVLKEMGYDAVEWRVNEVKENPENPFEGDEKKTFEFRYWLDNKATLDVNNIKEDAKLAKKYSDEAGIEVFALTSYLNTDEYDKLKEVYEAAEENDISMVRVGLVTLEADYDKEERNVRDLNKKMRSDLERLVELSKETGVKTVIEIHMDTLISSPSAAYNMLKGLDPDHIGVIFDPGNMVKEGYEEYRKAFELLGDYIAHVHIKNGRYVEKEERDDLGAKEFEFTWTPLKDGQVNFKRIFEVMKKSGYKGNISVEDFSNEKETKEKLKDNLDYINKLKDYAENL